MELLVKAAGVCAVGAVFALLIKKQSPDIALLLTVALGGIILYLASDALRNVTDFFEELAEIAGLSPGVVTIVLKTVGIAVITKFAADICRDAGQSSAASAMELMGSATALYLAFPLMKTVLKMIQSLV